MDRLNVERQSSHPRFELNLSNRLISYPASVASRKMEDRWRNVGSGDQQKLSDFPNFRWV